MNQDCGVYALLNTATGKLYVGSSVCLRRRYNRHLRDLRQNSHRNSHLQRAWQQDATSFAIGVLELCEPDSVREREAYWIAELQAADREFGYNLDMVRDYRITPSAETRAKLSAALKGHVVSAETRTRMQAAPRGPRPPLTTTHRAKIQAALQGRVFSPETRAKMSAALQGHTHSPETLAKLSATHKGRMPSPETRAKLSAAGHGRVFTPERCANISEGKRNPSLETRMKLSEASRGNTNSLGHRHSAESIAKMSAARKLSAARKRQQAEQEQEADW